MLTNYLTTKSKDILKIEPILLAEKILITDEYQKKIVEYLKDDMELKANVDLKNQNVLITLRTGAAGATVLNAKSTSKVKGKDKSKNQALSDEPIADLSFMNKNQLQKKVLEKIKDLPEENADIIVEHMLR